jgi:hypothetical protein
VENGSGEGELMANFEMWAGGCDLYRGRSTDAEPDCVDALTYLQGTPDTPREEKRLCVALLFSETIGALHGAVRAEVRMEVETARALRDKLDALLERIDRGTLELDDEYDYAVYGIVAEAGA